MAATRSLIPSRSDIRLADNILCAARRAAATLAALTLFTTAGLSISVAATRPISVTTDAAVAVDPIVPVADDVWHVLTPPPSSLTSSHVSSTIALVPTVPTSKSRFWDDLPASDQPREASGRLLSLVISLLVALVGLASGIYLYASKARTPARQSAATAIYLAGAAFILYNTGALHEVWLGSRVSAATNFTDYLSAWAAAGSPLVLVFVGLFLISTARIGENHWPRWSGTLGMVSIAAAAYVIASAFFRTEALVFVDNATDAPYRVTVDGVPLGVLDARSHASFVLCRGGLLHQHAEPATLSLQRPQDPAPRTSLISLDARQFRRMVVNVEGRNSYETVRFRYQ
jgi:hypothetical protein